MQKIAKIIDAGSIIPLYNQEILKEYDDALHRAKFPFSERAIKTCFS